MHRGGFLLGGLLVLTAACGGSDLPPDLFGGAAGPTTGGSSTNAGGGGSRATSGVSVGVGGDSTIGSGGSGAGGSTGGNASGTGGAGGPGGASGTTGNAGTGPGTDGGSRDASSRDASVNCSALQADVTRKLAAAQVCAPTSGSGVCLSLVNGLCCHVPVAWKDSEATGAYLNALAAFNANRCVAACPAIPCPGGMPSCQRNANDPTTSFSCQN